MRNEYGIEGYSLMDLGLTKSRQTVTLNTETKSFIFLDSFFAHWEDGSREGSPEGTRLS